MKSLTIDGIAPLADRGYDLLNTGFGRERSAEIDAMAKMPPVVCSTYAKFKQEIYRPTPKHLYIPPGTMVLPEGFTIYYPTMISGAGQDATEMLGLSFMGPNTPVDGNSQICQISGSGSVVIRDLTFRSASTCPNKVHTIRGTPIGINNSILFDRVTFDFGEVYDHFPVGASMTCMDFLMRDCSIRSLNCPFNIHGKNVVVTGSRFRYHFNRIKLINVNGGRFENNVVDVVGLHPLGAYETGGLEPTLTSGLVIKGNVFRLLNLRGYGDGELITTQISGIRDQWGRGTVTGGTASELVTDIGAGNGYIWLAKDYREICRRKAIFVLTAGRRQYRFVDELAPGTYRPVDPDTGALYPFSPAPQAGDVVYLTSVSSYRMSIVDNEFHNTHTAASFWNGSVASVIRRNRLYNAGNLLMRGTVGRMDADSPQSYMPIWDLEMSDNVAYSELGNGANFESAPTRLFAYADALSAPGDVVVARNVRIMRNQVIGPNPSDGIYAAKNSELGADVAYPLMFDDVQVYDNLVHDVAAPATRYDAAGALI